MSLVLDKLKLFLDYYNKAKRDSIRVIQGCVYQNKFCLLKEKIIAREMWLIFQKEFDISWASEIKTITNAIFYKLFDKFKTVSNYCQAFQKAYNKIASRLINNHGGYNQNKHYKIIFRKTILDKLLVIYALLVATINDK